ncbi:MAG: SDR family oxidoreductase [Rhodospirillales bacterium]|nr:SDR family oxidoreductase [Rhodospirillales bacterium]
MNDVPERIAPELDFRNELAGMFDLSGQVVYMPGGYGGIGEACAWALCMHGAKVVISGRSLEKAEKLAANLRNGGFEAEGIGVDVTSVDEIRASVDKVVETFGGLDILLNCTGIQIEQPMLEVTEEAFDQVYRVNLKASMFLGQAAAKHMIETGRKGRIIHFLSVRSQLGIRNRGYSAYCSTKGGQVMMIKQHAMELAPHGINVNGVAPTFVYTEQIRHVMENPEFRKYLYERIPLGRIADPKDIVGPVTFFCSPSASFVTGQTMYVDGGITCSQ